MTAPNDPLVRFFDPETDHGPYVGIIGEVCGRQSREQVVRLTPRGPLHRAKCNRWLDHDGDHIQRHRRTWTILYQWTDKESRDPDHRELHRVESVRSRQAVSFQVTSPEGDHFV